MQLRICLGDRGNSLLFNLRKGESVVVMGPTGDKQGRFVSEYQPATLAAMEALWETQPGAPLIIIGQPNPDEKKIDNPVYVPKMLSFLTYRRWNAEVRGLDAFPKEDWPQNVPLLYYSYHIMVGLGTSAAFSGGAAHFGMRTGCTGSCCCHSRCPISPTPPAG